MQSQITYHIIERFSVHRNGTKLKNTTFLVFLFGPPGRGEGRGGGIGVVEVEKRSSYHLKIIVEYVLFAGIENQMISPITGIENLAE